MSDSFCFRRGGGWFSSVCSGCCCCCVAFVFSWLACRVRCVLSGSVCVSWCRCVVFVSAVHPVAILRAVFWMICSSFRFVSDIIGDQIVLLYSITGLVIAL